MRLIDDREKEIESFKPDEYWNVDVTLGAGHKSFTARLATDSKGKKLLPKNEAEARAIEKGLEGAEYVVAELKKGKRAKQPTPAFITSTLQQEASRRLGSWGSSPRILARCQLMASPSRSGSVASRTPSACLALLLSSLMSFSLPLMLMYWGV